jgi:hypothetical protein
MVYIDTTYFVVTKKYVYKQMGVVCLVGDSRQKPFDSAVPFPILTHEYSPVSQARFTQIILLQG